MAKRLLNGCVVVLATFFVPLSIILAAAGSYLISGFSEEASQVDIDIRIPEVIVQREPFFVDVIVTNNAGYVQTLDDIDFNSDFLEAVEVVDTIPRFSRKTAIPFLVTYWFEREIQPSETLNVSLEMVAREPGTHLLLIGVCINVPSNCMNVDSMVVVTE